MVFTLYCYLVRSNTWSVSVFSYHNPTSWFLVRPHSYIDSLFITSFRLYQFSHLPHFWRGSILELFLVRTQFRFALVFNQISFSSRAQHPPRFSLLSYSRNVIIFLYHHFSMDWDLVRVNICDGNGSVLIFDIDSFSRDTHFHTITWKLSPFYYHLCCPYPNRYWVQLTSLSFSSSFFIQSLTDHLDSDGKPGEIADLFI